MKSILIAKCAGLGLVGLSLIASASVKEKQKPLSPVANQAELDARAAMASSATGLALHNAWVKAAYRLAPEVKADYLAFAKANALRELQVAGKTLPADFLAWVDSDPIVAETVYGARIAPANVLLMLRSLDIDLGSEIVRKKYTQLALAMSVVHAEDGPHADIAPRPLLALVIPACPLKPVNTKETTRPLDANDHIINFLNEHFIEDVPADRKWTRESKELAYDSKGVATAGPGVGETATSPGEKVKRPLTAADVMASAELQHDFNEYMKAHGQSVQIDCGDHVIYPDRHDMIKGEDAKRIRTAYQMFKTAYEAKGLLPAQREVAATPAESCLFLIRNLETKTPAASAKKALPHCPLTAPWPVLTLLAADTQPLREREDIWERYHDRGELHTYGEYIGGIAQQFEFQSARRLAPYAFSYGTFQMMLKDGGVCGTMANMGVRTYETLGIPSCTAGQPGHCALILFAQNKKTGMYECDGGQFATGGPDDTHPHTPWYFGDVDAREPMVYHQTIAWAVNAGFQSYLDSTIAYDLFRLLPAEDRRVHGLGLLESGLSIDPYNFLLADAAVAIAATPAEQIHFWREIKSSMASFNGKPGCPVESLYMQTVRSRVLAAIASLPVPADKAAARQIYAFLKDDKCDNAATLALYQSSVDGITSLLERTQTDFKTHLASIRTDASCSQMSAELEAAAKSIPDKAGMSHWISERLAETQGHELYFGHKDKVMSDAAATTLARLSGKKLPAESALIHPLLDQLAVALKVQIGGERDPKTARQLAGQITSVAHQFAESSEIHPWLENLSAIMGGHEEFTPKNSKKGKIQRDPCADAIAQLLSPAPAAK